MAQTLKIRSGKALSQHVYFWLPVAEDGTRELVDTTGSTARIQLRGTSAPRRVLMSTSEYNGSLPSPPGTVLTRIEPGHWLLFLGKSITRSLPSRVTVEMELENDLDPEDTVPLFEATLMVEPEAVVNV